MYNMDTIIIAKVFDTHKNIYNTYKLTGTKPTVTT